MKLSTDKRAFVFSILFSLFFTFCLSLGISIKFFGTVWILFNIYLPVIIFLISWAGFYALLVNLSKISDFVNKTFPFDKYLNIFFQNNVKSFWICFLFITICRFPFIAAYFPGVFAYDSYFQIQFFLSPEHIEVHPVIHSLMLYCSYLLYKVTHSSNFAIFSYTLLQQIIMNLIFSWCTLKIARYGKSTLLNLFALLFFALYPLNGIFPMIATKDVLFSGFVLLFVVISIDLLRQKHETKRETQTAFVLSAILMLLFKHNGILAYIFIIPFYSVFMLKNRQKFAQVILLLLIPVFFFSGFNAVKSFIGIKPPPVASSISIPLQQIGRVRLVQENNLSFEDKSLFKSLVSEQNETAYSPLFADRMKINDYSLEKIQYSSYLENTVKTRQDDFINLYLKWFKLYPKDYVDAFLITNHSLWSLCARPSDIFRTEPQLSNLYILTHVSGNIYGMPTDMTSYNAPLSKYFDELLSYYGFENNAFTFILFSIAVNTWVFLSCLIILLYKRKYEIFVAFLINFALLLTMLFGPVTLVRYVYQNFLIIPLLFTFCFGDTTRQIEENKPQNAE